MKKALMVATVVRFLGFERNNIKLLHELGYEVHCATNLINEKENTKSIDMIRHQIDFARSPFSKQTIVAYRQLKKLMEEEHFDLIHCHTPVGGVCARLAARSFRKSGTKVIYTAHGFHFFRGAPLKNWLLYYPVEKLCSLWTDVLITINKEDYALAQKKMKAKKVVYIPGVGIDLKKFHSGLVDRDEKRKELGLKPEDKMLLSVGELSKRKNHQVVIKAIGKLNDPAIHYFICGEGSLREELEKEVQEISSKIHFLGFRTDISELLQAADLFVFPSLQEGLPVALMEAIACKVSVVCSRIRGNTDLVKDETYLFDPRDREEIYTVIRNKLNADNSKIVDENYKILQNYDILKVQDEIEKNYFGGALHRLILRQNLEKELDIKSSKILILSVGELNRNKNHETAIRAIVDMDDVNYIIAGEGERHEYLQKVIDEYGIAERVKLLGYRSDIKELLEMADVFVFPSFREGLSVSVMEAMASGLPVVCSRIRGNADLIDENRGELFNPHSVIDCRNKIKKILSTDRRQLGIYNVEKVKKFSLEIVNDRIVDIFREL